MAHDAVPPSLTLSVFVGDSLAPTPVTVYWPGANAGTAQLKVEIRHASVQAVPGGKVHVSPESESAMVVPVTATSQRLTLVSQPPQVSIAIRVSAVPAGAPPSGTQNCAIGRSVFGAQTRPQAMAAKAAKIIRAVRFISGGTASSGPLPSALDSWVFGRLAASES